MIVLVLNCGSSSLKFQFIDTDTDRIRSGSDTCLARGGIERIGTQSLITIKVPGRDNFHTAQPIRNHKEAIDFVLRWALDENHRLPGLNELSDIAAVGHRVVHGGENFSSSVIIDKKVIKGIQECAELAPLHNPANLLGIHAITELLGDRVPQAAVFDTAFHAQMPESAYLYALPYQYYARYKVRRYGFHGTSHRYVAQRYREITGRDKAGTHIISLHLGNGASACAIRGGQSIDTSMGFTPTEGLVMGTRSGDIDPAILEFLHHKEGLTFVELTRILNKESGLNGISGLTNDMRELVTEVEQNGDRRARLAIDIFCMRVKKYIGAYLAELGRCDALVFTGGIGENNTVVRHHILTGLENLGIEFDAQANSAARGTEADVSTPGSRIKTYVIPTNEELLIARDTYECVARLKG